MAGPYVHCLVTRESLKKLYNDASLARHQSITNPDESSEYFPYICLGSVSPDLPYPALAMGLNAGKDQNGWTWGDKFHKQNTGNFIDIGIQQLRGVEDKTSDQFLIKAAWLMGYYCHVITDLLIHAVVYELVGGCYENHKKDHLYSEVMQDSLLFYEVYRTPPQELIDVCFIKGILKNCHVKSPLTPSDDQVPTYMPPIGIDADVKNIWDSILRQNYTDFYSIESPDIDNWFLEYSAIMSVATKVVARIAAPDMAYHRTADIPPGDKARYYTNITLPDKTTGSYKVNVFDKTVEEVTKRLTTFLNAIDNTNIYSVLKTDLRPWNMDKGTINDTSPEFALWNGRTEYPFNCDGDPPRLS